MQSYSYQDLVKPQYPLRLVCSAIEAPCTSKLACGKHLRPFQVVTGSVLHAELHLPGFSGKHLRQLLVLTNSVLHAEQHLPGFGGKHVRPLWVLTSIVWYTELQRSRSGHSAASNCCRASSQDFAETIAAALVLTSSLVYAELQLPGSGEAAVPTAPRQS